MRLVVDVDRYFDWALTHESEVPEGAVTLPSHHGKNLRLVRELVEKPNYVEIHLPDGDVDRMVAEHEEGIRVASQGYRAVHEGGSAHGQEVDVPARSLPRKSRDKLIAEHLGNTVLPQHCESHHIRKVKVVDGYRDAEGNADEDPKKLERYLNRQLVEDAPDEDAEQVEAVEGEKTEEDQ